MSMRYDLKELRCGKMNFSMKSETRLLIDQTIKNTYTNRSKCKKISCVFITLILVILGSYIYLVQDRRSPIVTKQYLKTPASIIYPAQILAMNNWAIAMKPYPDISVRNLFTYNDTHFYVNDKVDSVVFRSPIVYDDKMYPNLLVERNGTFVANWNPNVGIHMLQMSEAVHYSGSFQNITLVMVRDCCQVLLEVAMNGQEIIAKNQTTTQVIDPNYTLDKVFRLELVIARNRAQVFYDDAIHAKATFDIGSSTTAHFMVGAAVHVNSVVDSFNATEVLVQSLRLRHSF